MLLLKRAFQVKCFSEEWLGEAGQQRLRRLEMRLWWELQVISHFHLRYLRCFANSTMKCICRFQELGLCFSFTPGLQPGALGQVQPVNRFNGFFRISRTPLLEGNQSQQPITLDI